MECQDATDSPGFDICQVRERSLKELHKICQFIPYAEGFNSDGYIKYHIAHNDLKNDAKYRLYTVRRPPEKMEYTKEFPKAFCINLERRPDRKQAMEGKIAKFGFPVEFVNAVDGKQLTMTDEIRHMFRGSEWHRYNCGIIGCALSHMNLWKKLLESDDEIYIVLEDDEEFCDNFREKISHALAQVDGTDWDMLYLGFIIMNSVRDPIKLSLWNDNIPKVTPFDNTFWGGGTGGYIINRKGAKKLLDVINENGLPNPIDHLPRSMPHLNRFTTIPHLVYNDYVGPGSTNKDTDIQLVDGRNHDFLA